MPDLNLDTLRLSHTYAELRAMSDEELAALQSSLGEFVTQQHPRLREARILNDMIRDVRSRDYGWERYR